MPTTTLDWAALASVIVAFILIYLARKKLHVGFTPVVLGALVVGAGIGFGFTGHTQYIEPFGTIYVGLLTALVAPIVIVSILSAVTSLKTADSLKGIGLKSVGWLLTTTAIAIGLALAVGLGTGIGKGANLSVDGVDPTRYAERVTPVTDVIIGFFPSNLVEQLGSNKLIPIILFTALIAVSYVLVAQRKADQVAPFRSLVEAVKLIVFKAVSFIISLTPYAVLALVAVAASNGNARGDIGISLAWLLGLSVVVLLFDTYVVNAVLVRVFARVPAIRFFRRIAPAQAVAFTTQSSAGTLPVTTDVLTKRVGVSGEVAGFTAPLGATIGMPGCAGIWPVLVAIYGIHGLGIEFSAFNYAVLAVLALLVSLGTAGVPGTATITTATVLTATGLPLEILVLTLPISAIVDMFRTNANVTAAAVASTIVAASEGQLDRTVLGSADVDAGIKNEQLTVSSLTAEPQRDRGALTHA
jgi:Na+/H+-dicarboxylate symporter